jgi:hypothetical protein
MRIIRGGDHGDRRRGDGHRCQQRDGELSHSRVLDRGKPAQGQTGTLLRSGLRDDRPAVRRDKTHFLGVTGLLVYVHGAPRQ